MNIASMIWSDILLCCLTWLQLFIVELAVSTRPEDGDLSRFVLEFCWPLRAFVRSIALRTRILSALARLCEDFY